MAHLLTYADASGVLCYESTSRAMRDLVQSFETSLWSALLRATWPREGEALASLGNGFFPRSDGGSDGPRPVMAPDSCRRIFRAFRTSRDARTNIARLESLTLSFDHGEYQNVRSTDHFLEFIADVVKQTHAPVTGRPGDDYNSDRTSYTSDSDGRSDY